MLSKDEVKSLGRKFLDYVQKNEKIKLNGCYEVITNTLYGQSYSEFVQALGGKSGEELYERPTAIYEKIDYEFFKQLNNEKKLVYGSMIICFFVNQWLMERKLVAKGQLLHFEAEFDEKLQKVLLNRLDWFDASDVMEDNPDNWMEIIKTNSEISAKAAYSVFDIAVKIFDEVDKDIRKNINEGTIFQSHCIPGRVLQTFINQSEIEGAFGYKIGLAETISQLIQQEQIKQTIIPIFNAKGGTGKTTTALALADNLVSRGFKTLIIDLDPGGYLSYRALGDDTGKTFYSCVFGDEGINHCIRRSKYGFDIIPGNESLRVRREDLSRESELEKRRNMYKLLETTDYEFVILDLFSISRDQEALMAMFNGIETILCPSIAPSGWQARGFESVFLKNVTMVEHKVKRIELRRITERHPFIC